MLTFWFLLQLQLLSNNLQPARWLLTLCRRISQDWRSLDHETDRQVAGKRHLSVKQANLDFAMEKRLQVEAW